MTHDVLVTFAAANGVSVNSLVEAILGTLVFEVAGRDEYDVAEWTVDPMADAWRKVIADARIIDARNRAR